MLEAFTFLFSSSISFFFFGLGGFEGLGAFYFILDCPRGSNCKGNFCTSGDGLRDSLSPSLELIVWFKSNSMSGVAAVGALLSATFSREVSFSWIF